MRLLLSFLILIIVNPVRALPPSAMIAQPVVQLDKPGAAHFSDTLKLLSAKGRVTFVVEGQPLQQTLEERVVSELSKARAPLSRVVQKVAAAYDYDAERRGSVFVLKKRYSNPQDLPGITPEECILSVQDVLRVLARFSPQVPVERQGERDPLIGELMASFTREQLEALADTQKGVHVASLSPHQQDLAWRIALYFYVQYPEEAAKGVLRQIRCAQNEETWFGWSTKYGPRLFGFEGPFGSPPKPFFWPLSSPNIAQILPEGAAVVTLAPGSDHQTEVPGNQSEADPTAPVKLPAGTAPQQVCGTLGEAVSALAARQGQASPMAVDEALAAKPITVIGGELAPSAQILDALAEVYGLRVKREEDGTLRLTRRLWRLPAQIAALPEALRIVFPEPLMRAMHTDPWERLQRESRADTSDFHPEQAQLGPGQPKTLQEGRASQEQQNRRADELRRLFTVSAALRVASVRSLRTKVEPKLRTAEDGRVPFVALDASERIALANILMADSLQALQRVLSHTPPDSIRRFDETILTGGLGKNPAGRQKCALFLSLPGPDGSVTHPGPGRGNVDYIK